MSNEVLVRGGVRLGALQKEQGYTQEQLAELTKLSTPSRVLKVDFDYCPRYGK